MIRPNRKVAGWIIALCGLWEAGDIAALFVPNFGQIPAFLWNHILVGVFLMVAGVWIARTRNAATARTMCWLATGAAAWLIIAALIFGNPANAAGFWNDVIVGMIVLSLGIWTAFAITKSM